MYTDMIWLGLIFSAVFIIALVQYGLRRAVVLSCRLGVLAAIFLLFAAKVQGNGLLMSIFTILAIFLTFMNAVIWYRNTKPENKYNQY